MTEPKAGTPMCHSDNVALHEIIRFRQRAPVLMTTRSGKV